jgi:hypothetical protein
VTGVYTVRAFAGVVPTSFGAVQPPAGKLWVIRSMVAAWGPVPAGTTLVVDGAGITIWALNEGASPQGATSVWESRVVIHPGENLAYACTTANTSLTVTAYQFDA